jgi:hypothetical protein
MTGQIVMWEIGAYNKIDEQAETLRFCDGLAYRLRPTETPANELYRPFVIDAGWTRVDIFTRPGQYGQITPGELMLDDSSGTLGAQLINYAFDGRGIIQRIGTRGAAYPDDFVTVINGAQDGQPSFDWGKIVIRPADLGASMRKPLQSARYAGDNALPGGVEGVDDLKGQVKPMVLALASNMAPICVNTSKQIYQVSIPIGTSAISVSAVRDKGVPLTPGAAYADMTALLATAPAASGYRILSNTTDGTFIRLGSQPIGQPTCDAAYGNAADRTHAQVWKRILNYAGVADGSISSADVSTLDTALPAEIEYALLAEIDVDRALSEVANSACAGWYGDPVGVYRLLQWAAPAGAPIAELNSLRTDSMDIADAIGNGDVAPAYRVTLQYGRNWAVQTDSDLGGDKTSPTDVVRAPGGRAGLAARVWLASEYRTVQKEVMAVKTPHPNAIELRLTSLIADQAAAQTFCDAQQALYGVARHMVPLTQWLSPAQIDLIRPGVCVTVKEARWGYDAGRLMRVAGVMIDRGTGKAELNCWG